MISEGLDLIKLMCLLNVFGKAGLSNSVDPDQTAEPPLNPPLHKPNSQRP